MNYYIYILELQQGKYYIGKTINPYFTPFLQKKHKNLDTEVSEWLKLYKPVRMINILPLFNDNDEDKYTISYMNIYGIDNVRGGSYSSLLLDEPVISKLKDICNENNSKCFICDQSGHFAKDCNEYKYWESDSDDESNNDMNMGLPNVESEKINENENLYRKIYKYIFRKKKNT